jgi:hypothetical protein
VSQPATEPPPGRAAGGNPLTRKIGGVPAWGWIAAVAALAGGFLLWRQHKASAAAAASSDTGSAAGPTQATCYDANGNQVDCADPSAVGSNATDYFESLYAQGEGINSQLEGITPTINDTGQDVDSIQAWLQAHPGTPSTPPPVTTTPPPKTTTPAPATKTMPNLVGQRANFAIGELKSGYGVKATTSPVRNPKNEYTVTGQTPKAGAKVAAGSSAVLNVKVIKAAAA